MIRDCEEKVLTDLYFVDRVVREGDRQFRTGDKAAALARYHGAHETLRRAIGTARGCLTTDRLELVDHRFMLRRLLDVADRFEHFEKLVEGKGG